MTKQTKNRANNDTTYHQDKMASIAENQLEDALMTTNPAEKDDQLGEDGKRRRTTVDRMESPNRRSPKSPKPDDDSMEEDTVCTNPTNLEETSEETFMQTEEDDKKWAHFDEKQGWTFKKWKEMTQTWKDIPKGTKDKASPFLSEDMKDNFLLGRHSRYWEHAQQAWILSQAQNEHISSRRRWAASLIDKTWLTSWDMWEHRGRRQQLIKPSSLPSSEPSTNPSSNQRRAIIAVVLEAVIGAFDKA